MEKKEMKLWKKILLIILVLIVVFAIVILKKYIIITTLINASKNYDSKTNFMAEMYTISNDSMTLNKIYYKDEDFLMTAQTYSSKILNERKTTAYLKDNEKIVIIQSGEDKVALLNGNMEPIHISTISEFDDIKFKIPLAFTARITTEKCNNKKCYLIEVSKDYKIWVEKDTGIIVREINIDNVTNRTYTFDVVKDEEIIKPDVSDCKIQE